MAVASVSLLSVLGVTIERLVYFDANFVNLTVYNENGTAVAASCNSWVCTNDSLFAIVALVNIGEQ